MSNEEKLELINQAEDVIYDALRTDLKPNYFRSSFERFDNIAKDVHILADVAAVNKMVLHRVIMEQCADDEAAPILPTGRR